MSAGGKPPSTAAATPAGASAVSAEQLAELARGGDLRAFDELVARHRPKLIAFLARRLADAADAEDVAQETFLRAYDHLDRYDPARPFATWLFAIGKNTAANHALARTRREARDHRAAAESSAAEPLEQTAARDAAGDGDVWARAARVLSPGAYRILWLRYAQGMTVREIAAAVARSSVAIKVTLYRARRRMLQEVR